MADIRRFVIGPNEDGLSAVLVDDVTNVQEAPGIYWRATLWATTENPADNTIDGDRAEQVTTREPETAGLIFRALEIPPDIRDQNTHRDVLSELNRSVRQKYSPTATDVRRHPTMHRTDTLDCFAIVAGEIYIVTDADETLLRPGDTVVVRGVNHAWSNRTDKPALIVGTMTHAAPWPPHRYPPAGCQNASAAVNHG
jgi:mannose-6-phosphate isomerase-like protein (cupin superfamily)